MGQPKLFPDRNYCRHGLMKQKLYRKNLEGISMMQKLHSNSFNQAISNIKEKVNLFLYFNNQTFLLNDETNLCV
jgi:hypothetical protein